MATDETAPANQTLEQLNLCLKGFQDEIQKSITGLRGKLNSLGNKNLFIEVIPSEIMKQSAICTTE